MDNIAGFFTPILIYAIIFALNVVLPGRWVTGYVNKPDSAEKMRYHLNGFTVFFILLLIWLLFGYFDIVPFDYLYNHRWYGLAGAFITGIVFTVVIVLPFPPVSKSFLTDLFLGRIENLQLRGGRADVKMWLYLTGAIMLGLNALSFSAHHWILYRDQASTGILLSTLLIIYFIVDYLIFEEVHLFTYDLFAERIGFKLGWGCMVFYPYFYPVFLWATVDLPDPQTPVWLLAIYFLIFLAGWILSRGANMQKYYFKRNPERVFLGIVPEAITNSNKTLLVNGFWGISRHINYLGEIFMATGMVLCTGYPKLIWPWLYQVYYIVFLFLRQRDDDKRCSLKYGELWKVYVKKVPWRIIPYIY